MDQVWTRTRAGCIVIFQLAQCSDLSKELQLWPTFARHVQITKPQEVILA